MISDARVESTDEASAPEKRVEVFARKSGNIPSSVIGNVHNVQRSVTMLASRVLADSDIAIRQDRRYQMMMRHDPDVMSPLQQRRAAVAMLPWSIVPEDETDQEQVDQAETLERLIRRRLRRPTELLDKLSDAIFYGPSAANVIYREVEDEGTTRFAPTDWYPLHPDSLVFQDDGTLGMMVNARWPGGNTVQARRGRAVIFRPAERRSIVLHTWNRTAPDYEGDPEEARYLFSGRGLRDTIFFAWLQKMTAQELWFRFVERYSLGTRVGYFPSGNPSAQAAMEDLINNLVGDASLSIPWEDGLSADEQPWQVKILDHGSSSGSDFKVFADLIEGYLAGQMKEMIIGQTATTEATATGLGSDVGTRHAETFARLIRADALALGESLTHELVRVLSMLNFGDTTYLPRWEFAIEEVDSEQWMDGAKKAHEMGVPLSLKEIRGKIGAREPEEDELTTTPASGGGLFGGLDESLDRFRRAL